MSIFKIKNETVQNNVYYQIGHSVLNRLYILFTGFLNNFYDKSEKAFGLSH